MDSQEILDLYMEDTRENLNIISSNILALESDVTNASYIQNIFRAAHTIKGAAATMEFADITKVTHRLEDLFGAIRDGKLPITAEIITIVLTTLDCLESLHDKLEDETLVVDLSVVDTILTILNQEETVSNVIAEEGNPSLVDTQDGDSRFNNPDVFSLLLNEDSLAVFQSFDPNTCKAYFISAKVDDGCDYKSIRLFMLLNSLVPVGEVVSSTPSTTELEGDNTDFGMIDMLFVSSKDDYDVQGALNDTLEVEIIECTDISEIISEFSEVQIKEVAPESVDIKTETPTERIQVSPETEVKGAPVKPSKTKVHKDNNLYVRVHTKTLDTLLNEQGELLLESNRLTSLIDRIRKGEVSNSDIVDILGDIGGNINKINGTQQNIIMSTRMFPLEQLFTMFPRMVRDLSVSLNKQVEFVVNGQDTELDRTILEKVSDPLKHIIRNAVDHGVEMPDERAKAGKSEKGTVILSAKQESDSVIITIQDDGKGMDADVLRKKAVEKGLYTEAQAEKLTNEEIYSVIFTPGFSTAATVTEVSGRGVGMDIVKSGLAEIGGVVYIDSKLGVGTTFTVKIPLTLAISQALLVGVADEKYVVLINYIQEVCEVSRELDIKRIHTKDHIIVRGEKIYPLIYLRDVYDYEEAKRSKEHVILISNNGRDVGIVVDSVFGQQDIVVKSLNKYFGGSVKYEAGITKLGDGSIPIIVDIPAVMEDF